MWRAMLIGLAVAVCCVSPVTSDEGVLASDRSETIVYTALRPAGWDIYLYETPGGPGRRLTTHESLDYNAAVSPDGRWLVFCSERRGNPDLFLLDLEKLGSPRLLVGTDAMEDAPAFSPDGAMLVFVSSRDGNADVFSMPFSPEKPAAGASGAINLTQSEAGDFNPAFSPDGRLIAFASDRDAYKASDIYIMEADGSNPRRLTRSEGWDGSPAWSADGTTLFFYSQREGGERIYNMSVDGSNVRPVTSADEKAVSPTLTPSGRIAYAAYAEGRWQIVSVTADGSDRRVESAGTGEYWAPVLVPTSGRLICHGGPPSNESGRFASRTPGPFLIDDRHRVALPDRTLRVAAIRGYFPATNNESQEVASDEGFERIVISRLDGRDMRNAFTPKQGEAWRPAWSKDGQWLACSVGPTFGRPDERCDIWKFRLNGSDAVNLTEGSDANDAFPDFSPDGAQIVFRSGRAGNHDIYLMNADGSNVRPLTEHEAVDTMPAFSPTGDRIALTSNRSGDYEVYVLQLESAGNAAGLRRVTHSPGRDTHPKFSPDGKWLVFASERGGMNDEAPLIPVFNPQPYGDIFVMRLADGKTLRMTHNKWEDGTPTWSSIEASPVASE